VNAFAAVGSASAEHHIGFEAFEGADGGDVYMPRADEADVAQVGHLEVGLVLLSLTRSYPHKAAVVKHIIARRIQPLQDFVHLLYGRFVFVGREGGRVDHVFGFVVQGLKFERLMKSKFSPKYSQIYDMRAFI
jgi:hypothetical protein